MKQSTTRSGVLLKQPTGYYAFSPALLGSLLNLKVDLELLGLLGDASLRLGRLDGIGRLLVNPDLFLSIFVRQEALLSSQIEGTQCTLDEVLNFSVEPEKANENVKDVINYIEAMNHGLRRLRARDGLPLSVRLLCEIHEILMEGARGQEKTPGRIRTSQNWVGGSSLATATYVPPPVSEMKIALTDLEKFLHEARGISPLIQIAIAHAQFETIHPFLDGNGRLGRLLITLFLCEKGLLRQPLLYLSHYLKGNQFEYYKRLTAIREDGDWEGWLKFFLVGVIRVGDQAISNAEALISLHENHHQALVDSHVPPLGFRLLDYLCEQPTVTVKMVEQKLNCSYMTAQRLIAEFEKLELLVESTGHKRNKRYEYSPYLALWSEIQDDFGSIDAGVIEKEKFDKAINNLRQHLAALELEASIEWEGWKIIVDKVEICVISQATYETLTQPLKGYRNASEKQQRFLNERLRTDTADLLHRILEKKTVQEFDRYTEYELQAIGKTALVNVFQQGNDLKFRFLDGDTAGFMQDASAIKVPWQITLTSDGGNRVQTKTVSVAGYGIDSDGAWMLVSPRSDSSV